jgi:hypothetical protein
VEIPGYYSSSQTLQSAAAGYIEQFAAFDPAPREGRAACRRRCFQHRRTGLTLGSGLHGTGAAAIPGRMPAFPHPGSILEEGKQVPGPYL